MRLIDLLFIELSSLIFNNKWTNTNIFLEKLRNAEVLKKMWWNADAFYAASSVIKKTELEITQSK